MFVSAQEEALDREAKRIELKRQANAARTERFLDARQRTIGLDLQALDAQVAEKRRNKQNNNDSDRLERMLKFNLVCFFEMTHHYCINL